MWLRPTPHPTTATPSNFRGMMDHSRGPRSARILPSTMDDIPNRPGPSGSLGRGAQIAARLVLPHLQRPEDKVDIGGVDDAPVFAADAGVDYIHMSPTPDRAALFEGSAIAGPERELHRAQIAVFDKIAPRISPARHLVHVREVVTQIAEMGLGVAALVLTADGADEVRIDDDGVGLDHQIAGIGENEIVRHSAVRRIDRQIATRQSHPFVTERRAGPAGGRRTGADPRTAAGYFRPFLLLDPRVRGIGVPFLPGRSDRRCRDRDFRQTDALRFGAEDAQNHTYDCRHRDGAGR